MKKVAVIVMLIMLCCIILTACTTTEKVGIIANYNSETKECTIINQSDKDYKKIQIIVSLYDNDTEVDEKIYKLERLDKNEKYKVKIFTQKDITSVVIKEYKHQESIFLKFISNSLFVIVFGGIYWLLVIFIIIFMRISKITEKQD